MNDGIKYPVESEGSTPGVIIVVVTLFLIFAGFGYMIGLCVGMDTQDKYYREEIGKIIYPTAKEYYDFMHSNVSNTDFVQRVKIQVDNLTNRREF